MKSGLRTTNWWSPEVLPRGERLASGNDGAASLWPAWLLIAAGGALVGFGLIRRDRGGLLSAAGGGALLVQSARWLRNEGITSSPELHFQRTITIAKPVAEVYQFWNRPENLSRFIPHVASVRAVDQVQHWVIRGPGKFAVEWDADIISNVPNRLISWQTLPGSPFHEWGSVEFHPGRGEETEVTLTMDYHLPGGRAGRFVAGLFGMDPEQQAALALRRLKQLLETGEIATTLGQSAGKRSAKDKIFGAALETSNQPDTRRRA